MTQAPHSLAELIGGLNRTEDHGRDRRWSEETKRRAFRKPGNVAYRERRYQAAIKREVKS